MLADQAAALAAAGWRAVSYDRRGTGRSGRHAWPGEGADQHADDAAAILQTLGAIPATVLGLSSGGVVALALAARHPAAVARVIVWEPPSLGVVPGGEAITAEIMAPIEAHLMDRPGDYVGAQALLLSVITGAAVTVDDPAFAAARANAEPMMRDEPTITLRRFTAAELARVPVSLAVGTRPNEAVAAGVEGLGRLLGTAPIVLTADHEVYLSDPSVLTAMVTNFSEDHPNPVG
jgi:pimeloyl-ACP methyl ester carboxylesterase